MGALHLVMCLGAGLAAAQQDNNVEWSGITHVTFEDRQPLSPINGETFAVEVRTWANDLTAISVWVDDGIAPLTEAAGTLVGTRGPYDIWQAQVPATASNTLTYYFQLTDGTDSDYLGSSGMSDSVPAGSEFEIDYATLRHAPLGATPHPGGGTVFHVWAPNSTTAYVRGEFNSWGLSDPMNKHGEYHTLYVAAADADEQYKFFFEPGAAWKPDARARNLNPTDNYNSRIHDTQAFAWNDDAFVTPPFEDMIVYELHVGTFSGRNDGGTNPGTYRQAVDLHINHLVELGINAVELLPITEFPWDYSGGYNPITAWAPESIWGDPDDLKYMIDKLHQNGIAVLTDIVWNHFSGSDNYLWEYDGSQIYFDTPVVDTPWGSQADFNRSEVREYFVDSTLMWLEEFHIDGFRMDATSFMTIQPSVGWQLMQQHNDVMDARWVDKISIAEQLPDDSAFTRPTSLGGAGFDSQWHDKFKWDVRGAIFDAAFGDPQMWQVRNAILGSGEYMEGRQVVNYIEAHDEAWPSSGGQRMVVTIDPSAPHDDQFAQGRTKVGHSLVMFSPGIPMFLQGCEFLEDTAFGASAPGEPDARLDWTKVTTYSEYLQYFKDMIALRRTNGALAADSPVDVSHLNESDDIIGIHRWDNDGNDLMIVFSLNNQAQAGYRVGFPQAGEWFEILNSEASTYGGSGPTNGSVQTESVAWDGFADSAVISIPPSGVLVFSSQSGAPGGEAIPAVSQWGLLVLVLLVFTSGSLAFRRGLVVAPAR
ncbi:MAG: alpha amylase C-terminal domain-containing protein [Planctomycetota bacterium]|jgi:1,4-alpha-glucan branching enzyme